MIKKNNDTSQASILHYKGKEYHVLELNEAVEDKKIDKQSILLQLNEQELEFGLKLSSAAILLSFQAYRELMTIDPYSDHLIFLQIKKKNEFDIWRNELCSNPKIIPVICELRTDWIKLVFTDRVPVIFEVNQVLNLPDFLPGYLLRNQKSKQDTSLDQIREQLKINQTHIFELIKQRRQLIENIGQIKKEKNIPVFQETVFLKNLLLCFNESDLQQLPVSDTLEIYMLLHELSVRQQEQKIK